jgi:epoxyqueuosine reductase
MDIEKNIKEKALELNYENCGIIPISDINDYVKKLDHRMKQFPETRNFLGRFNRFINLQERFSWAQSIIICVRRYGKYHIPVHLKNLYRSRYGR